MAKKNVVYAQRNTFLAGDPVAIGDELDGNNEEVKKLVRMGRASKDFPEAEVRVIEQAEKARRQAELADEQADSEAFDAAVEAAAAKAVEAIIARKIEDGELMLPEPPTPPVKAAAKS